VIDTRIVYPPEASLYDLVDALPFIERLGVNVVGYGRSSADIDLFAAVTDSQVREKDGHRWVAMRFASSTVEVVLFMARPEPTP
jgi:hypothetical protein